MTPWARFAVWALIGVVMAVLFDAPLWRHAVAAVAIVSAHHVLTHLERGAS